ncbi:immunoglobulin superfamily member 1-like isoform X2 [Malaclemys terrapin pileata]|uniref:immunoglobulin superfamily member 1-like isoform X2 n=1 Tax=Malaclemys terrapin pileata TaxID=2991368 RepID=UPI0023A88FA4|nr:immunoglobulin superfamily member 1-like isoform X2 [Malaclemys terrapin pileata]
MASALTILLHGCWFAGRSRVSGEWSLPKPSISVSPSGVIPMRGNVTIRCRNQYLGMRFLLYKAGDGNYLTYTDPAGSEAEFPITSARREHGGSYTCRYTNRTGRAAYSEPSDPVQIIVAELSYPKPSISLSPSEGVALGGAVTIRCRGSHQNVRFLLYKDGNLNALQDVKPAGGLAEFLIRNVSQGDAGSYSCYYHKKSNRFIWSHPSDHVELVVAGGSVPSAAPVLTRTIIAGASAAATVLLLLLLLAFVCYRKTRGKSSIDEGKQTQTLEPDPSTYAELDLQTLQPSVYGVINVSRGAPQ